MTKEEALKIVKVCFYHLGRADESDTICVNKDFLDAKKNIEEAEKVLLGENENDN